ncbi:hypothetical protein [Hymenobacter cellulosilyticus]|uniref:Uncharacterized protein n=1 Tax=Hymenobacter cellulosilyticus TaxID=2932248 RepID=A0A8T9PZX5_9BACT|nr:hypothetical protein [Hymenobacter cellulosilyticus]UOQ70667.1 hypothetical protein MUN79_18420 [Hymenobacter cellulosilyticus]
MEATVPEKHRYSLPPTLLRWATPVFWWSLFMLYEWVVFSGWEETAIITGGFVVKDVVATILAYYFFSLVVLPRFVLRRRWLLMALGLLGIYYIWGLTSYLYYSLLDHYGLISENAYDYMHRVIDYGLWGEYSPGGPLAWASATSPSRRCRPF